MSVVVLLRCGVACGDSYHLLDDDEHEGEGSCEADHFGCQVTITIVIAAW
jgi:hypothetical protein